MDTNLYIRHAVGTRLLLDCGKHQLPFDISHVDDAWRLKIENVGIEVYDLLVSNEKELNIFFQKRDGKKDWYYASGSPYLQYNSRDKTLTIIVDSKMSY